MAKWTREQIIRSILQREAAGQTLTTAGSNAVEPALHSAAIRAFGSWPNAVMAAGISRTRSAAPARWPPNRIIAAIRSLARRSRPLQPGELREHHSNLMDAARRSFGSWTKAIVASGVDPMNLRRVTCWTRERVIEAILTRALRNEPLRSRTVKPRSLADAGARLFGSWQAALAAAGVEPGSKASLTSNAADATSNPAAADQRMALGVEDSGRPIEIISTVLQGPASDKPTLKDVWTIEAIAAELSRRIGEGKPVNAHSIYKENERMYRAGLRLRGRWSNVLKFVEDDLLCVQPKLLHLSTPDPPVDSEL